GVAGKASTPVTVSKAGVRSFAGLLNGYWDVGTWGLFTPYVGAGIGFSANKVKDEKLSAAAVPGVTATVFGQERTSLAWDVTLGTAVRIADGFALDVGYRYIDLGKASLGPNGLLTTTATTLTFPTTRTPSDFSLRANEIQVGLRYSF
ncbi:MAG TPA: outer membrane beta-barrel protein, partial [Candidatus Cybelea sp.]|nr:outer membrane beta-barrel protein [Candidatus Cybelea sp.]